MIKKLIATTHEFDGAPIAVCWERDGKIRWACVEPAHPVPHQRMAEALDELSIWLAAGGKLQEQSEMWFVMTPDSLPSQLIMWLSDIERTESASVIGAYSAIQSAEGDPA